MLLPLCTPTTQSSMARALHLKCQGTLSHLAILAHSQCHILYCYSIVILLLAVRGPWLTHPDRIERHPNFEGAPQCHMRSRHWL